MGQSILNYLAFKGEDLNGVVRETFETIMELERDEFLGYAQRCRKEKLTENKRNGYTESIINGLNDSFTIRIPRDRLNNFKPFLIELIRQERNKTDNICFKLYAKGLTTRDIESIFQELYGNKYSKSSISRITSGFTQERERWQSRLLDSEYLVVYIDALRQSVKNIPVQKNLYMLLWGLELT